MTKALPAAAHLRRETEPWRPGWADLTGALVAAQVLASALVVARGFYYQDDYAFIRRCVDSSLLSPDLLLLQWNGHLMPAGMAASWILAHAAPFQYGAVIAGLVILAAAAAVLFRLVAIRLLGPGPAHAFAVVLNATSIAVLAASAWWAAAINVLPMLIALYACILLTHGTGTTPPSAGRQAWAMAWLACGLAFFEKAVLIPLVLFGLEWAGATATGTVAAAKETWRRSRRYWLRLGAVTLGYACAYLLTLREGSPAGIVGSTAVVGDTMSRALVTLATGLLGGPLQWITSFEAIGRPPTWLTVAALQLAGLMVAAVLVRPTHGAARWLMLAGGYVAACVAILLVGRPGAAALLGSVPRYFADAVPVVALCAAGALKALAPWPGLSRSVRTGAVLASANVLILLSIQSGLGLQAWLNANPTRGYVTRTLTALRAAPAGPVLDTPVDVQVLGPLLAPDNRLSSVFALVPTKSTFESQATTLTSVPPHGGLAASTVRGASARPGPETRCGWRVEGSGRIPLAGRTAGTVLEIAYIATGPGEARISVDGQVPTEVRIEAGLQKWFIALPGQGDSIVVTDLTPGVALCTDEVRFGTPEPLPAEGA
ncbi:MAG: hypothetical protein WCF04_09210 [Candidatus Nanopelagicales bacterium]